MKKALTLGLLRIATGWLFLWAFLDKLIGLGFATEPSKAWIVGGSPTSGFLSFATTGPFAGIFQGLAGSALIDWLFMLGLLFIGVSLMFGILMRLGTTAGGVLMVLMWLAVLPPAHNPFIDEHIIYLLVFILLCATHAGRHLGFGEQWEKMMQKSPLLK